MAVTPTTTISGGTTVSKKKKKEKNTATPEYRQRNSRFSRTGCVLSGSGEGVGSGKGKANRGGRIDPFRAGHGDKRVGEKARGKNEADVAEKGRADVFNGC